MAGFSILHNSSIWSSLLVTTILVSSFDNARANAMRGEEDPDTSAAHPRRSYALNEVVITSARIPSTALRSPAVVSLISRIDIERSGATTLGDILMTGPGIFIKDYGGQTGLKTISQRGLGTEHTLVLLNGMPVNSMQNGLLDLGTIPSEEIDRVELVRGGQSASFGANAVAGVVNLITRQQEGSEITARYGVASFGETEAGVSAGTGGPNIQWRIAGAVQHMDGDYPFTFSNGPTHFALTRTNAGMNARRCSGTLDAALTNTLRVRASGLYLESERGVPGIVTGPYSSSRADQRDQQGILQTGFLQTISPTTWWEVKLQGVYSYQRYADPDVVVNGKAINNVFRSQEGRAEAQYHADIESFGRITAGIDAVRAEGEGNTLAVSPLRTEGGVFFLSEHRWLPVRDSTLIVSFHPALRFDRVGGIADAFSPQIGVQALYSPEAENSPDPAILRLHGTVGRNFRTPTFNELYYSGGGGIGNPSLSPEYATTYDLGVGLSAAACGYHQFDATWFGASMTDRIIWVAAGVGAVTPKNVRKVLSRGVELSYAWSWPDAGTRVTASYSLSHTEKRSEDFPGDPNVSKQLPYAPEELLSCSAAWGSELNIGPLTRCDVTGTITRVGYRFTTEDDESFLPTYGVVGVAVALGFQCFGLHATLKTDFHNLLDESYEVMMGYPMPGRSYRCTVTLFY
jgi:iron complex outermembrane receptor protein